MPLTSLNLTEEERSIWCAAYAAAFVAEFERNRVVSHGYSTDFAARTTSSETAITIADLAVERLREWRSMQRDQESGITTTGIPDYWRA